MFECFCLVDIEFSQATIVKKQLLASDIQNAAHDMSVLHEEKQVSLDCFGFLFTVLIFANRRPL